MSESAERSPRILFEEPGSPEGAPPTRFVVALDVHWGRILDRRRQWYWPTEQIGSILAMSGPSWEPYTGPQDALAEWIAAAQDLETDLTPEQRERMARRRRLASPEAVTVTAAARTGNGPTTYGVLAALDTGEVAVLPADPHYLDRLVNSIHNTAADRSARTFIATLPQRWDNPYCWAGTVDVQEVGAIGPDTTRIQLPLEPPNVRRFLGDVLFAYEVFPGVEREGRATRPEAREDQQAMRRQVSARIEEVARQAHTMEEVPRWLLDLVAQLGIEP